ncbi:MAG TPA: MotA/TolQ/ExbB proton channel family protein [Nitrospirae bacterium]|nr:MotA/TolQ/ExbB proton channel family protein [Nitrospirota bacterium]
MFDLFIKGGILMYPIALCSFIAVAILINKSIQYRSLLHEIDAIPEEIEKKKPQIMTPILKAINEGCNDKELSVIGTRQIRNIEKGLSWLGLIATITPLLGLTGTVTGMIKAFMVIAESSSVNPSMLAGGIWEALITTASGLLVAIPIHVGHHYLEKQADEIAYMMKEISTVLYMRAKRDGI